MIPAPVDDIGTSTWWPEAASLGAVVRLLEQVEELPDGAVGTLIVGDGERPDGVIFVDDQRICWAAASGMSRRLTDLLRISAERPISTAALEAIVRECRSSGEPIGQALVRRGLVTEPSLERALLRHTSESLLILSKNAVSGRWKPRKTGLSPRHRFSTSRLLASTGALWCDLGASPATEDLRWIAESGASGVAYARHPGLVGGVVPVSEINSDSAGVRAVTDLGKWAVGTLDIAHAVEKGANAIVLSRATGESVAVWNHDALLYTAMCQSRQELSRILSHYAARHR